MTYSVKELFYTLQGEGRHAGRAAVFCRFNGCNLWSGREQHRANSICRFCDTDFLGHDVSGGKFATEELADRIAATWPGDERRFVVFTGGEPLLQLNAPLINAVKANGFEIAVETNGTIQCPAGIDWLCVSPKSTASLVCRAGEELKLVFPQADAMPSAFEGLAFTHFYLQPMDGPDAANNTRAAIDYCMAHPRWQLSLQTHKTVGIR